MDNLHAKHIRGFIRSWNKTVDNLFKDKNFDKPDVCLFLIDLWESETDKVTLADLRVSAKDLSSLDEKMINECDIKCESLKEKYIELTTDMNGIRNEIIPVNDDNFRDKVLASGKNICFVIFGQEDDFATTECLRAFSQFGTAITREIKICYIDAPSNQMSAQKVLITKYPTIVCYYRGMVQAKQEGFASINKTFEFIKSSMVKTLATESELRKFKT